MAFHWSDNVYTTAFTPRDHQVELLAACYESNKMICLGHQSSKEFIALKLIQELGSKLRSEGNYVVYLTHNGSKSMSTMLRYLTDFKVYEEKPGHSMDSLNEDVFNIYILSPYTFLSALRINALDFSETGVLIIENCHSTENYDDIISIYDEFYIKKCNSLKILGLAGPLHSAACPMQELSAMLEALEKRLKVKAETASDIVSVLRYSPKPSEYILQCAPFEIDELTVVLRDILNTHRNFLLQHRYDPLEIYQMDEFADELKDIPDPKKEPLEYIDMMLKVLHEMGPWCAYRLAGNMFKRIERQKIKTPHERHFLLLNFVNTAFLELHAICDKTFRKVENRVAAVERFSSPKVLRLINILRLFRPDEPINDKFKRIIKDIDLQNFRKITRELDNASTNIERIFKSTAQSRSIIDNLGPLLKEADLNDITELKTKPSKVSRIVLTNQTKSNPNGTRNKRKVFHKRLKRDDDQNDSLCAIIFCNDNHIPKILFDLLVEMSRHDSDLKYLGCQFTLDRTADPLIDPMEAEVEHRRQEEVLKSFRMHECNVLIGTSVLEEGIDLPKCNLVIRWDEPNSYRSYVHSKGRAKAVQSYHVILVGPKFDIKLYNSGKEKQLSTRSHIYICNLDDNNEPLVMSDSDTEKENQVEDKTYTFGSSKGTVKVLNPEVITNQPPTNSSVSLKEIKDDLLAIEDDTASRSSHDEPVQNNTLSYEVQHIDDILKSLNQQLSTTIIKELSPSRPDLVENSKNPPVLFQCMHSISKYEPNSNEYKQNLKKMEEATNLMVDNLAAYREIEKMLLENCANKEPSDVEHQLADEFNECIVPYKPDTKLLTSPSVDLGNAIALVNKYCSKLPSDTFTKLTPIWRCTTTIRKSYELFQCTLRLPINSPLKYDIVGLPMPSKVLARRVAAMQTCVELHKIGELDNNLQPIGKENFKAIDSDWEDFQLETEDENIIKENLEPRPGTTKRRQYYYKRIASQFCNCRPTVDTECYLYLIDLKLQCPIPEEQNTRGRKIYPPEDASQGFGILTLKRIPKISSFPIFTRSGEVSVSIQLSPDRVVLNQEEIEAINNFVNYTFSNVLRLQKFLMLFDPDSTENCIFIVPTIKTSIGKVIDWDFLYLIQKKANMMPTEVPEKVRKRREFDPNKFNDAVVMPWYRNQDQPQYFYVAEICPNLNPLSCFPGENYNTFKHYYGLKYGIIIQNCQQPLLDVDHTSARLNFLTPRYVNRKGVALPTSSEETKRAKRENLEQKQILVPELCTIHPFPASLWRTAVCLPCILYRINGLLLADDIRRKVAMDIGLGQVKLADNFEWPMLDFGWSLSEVLRKAKETPNSPKADDKNNKSKLNSSESNKKKDSNSHRRIVTTYFGDGTVVHEAVTDDEEVHFPKSANEIVYEGEKELQANDFVEIGTWSNDMANNITNDCNDYYDEEEEFRFLPSNVKFCDTQTRYGSPTFFDIKPHKKTSNGMKLGLSANGLAYNQRMKFRCSTQNFSDDSSLSSYDGFSDGVDDFVDEEATGKIAFSKNEAETFETEEEKEKRRKQLSIIEATNANEMNYQKTKNMLVGYDFEDIRKRLCGQLNYAIAKFVRSTQLIKNDIWKCGMMVPWADSVQMSKKWTPKQNCIRYDISLSTFSKLIPYVHPDIINEALLRNPKNKLSLDDLMSFNDNYVASCPKEKFLVEGHGDIFDRFNDYHEMTIKQSACGKIEKLLHLNFYRKEIPPLNLCEKRNRHTRIKRKEGSFSFDYQPDLKNHPGPSPSIILQGLTMSNANDGINLERLETIGDSFLKYAITTYLYITYENVHEGKLSHLRSKQVANLNLYRLGRRKMLGEYMIATKFEPHDNWLPPCYYVPKELEKAYIEAKIPPHHWKLADLPNIKKLSSSEICQLVREKAESLGLLNENYNYEEDLETSETEEHADYACFIPYNLVTQHSIPDKSVADCVEALIGAYLIECGPRGALLFMAWLGIRVLPVKQIPYNKYESRVPGSTKPDPDGMLTVYGEWSQPKSPLLNYSPYPEKELDDMLAGFEEFERILGYSFRDRSYLLQAMTHASYSPNRLTDCYQRLEFLGDAVLDYLITRHLYEDPRQHSPGALTDLRSALVNNTIFASLAVRHGFHKYFRHLSPGLNEVIDRFVRIQNENGHIISEEFYLLSEEECDDAEDVEVPKALGDVFESVAGAIFLDSGMSLDAVWEVYSNMMNPEIEQFSSSVPKSPIRELLELEPETAKFGKPEKLADGRRVRVSVEVFSKGTFRGIGRNYRIAKCTAAKCALRFLKRNLTADKSS